jgi:hypothetical protein
MAIKDSSFIQCLSNDSADELEEAQMLGIDTAHAVGMESSPVGCNWDKQCVVRIEHLPGHNLEPFPGNTTGVDTLLSVEPDAQLRILDFITSLVIH